MTNSKHVFLKEELLLQLLGQRVPVGMLGQMPENWDVWLPYLCKKPNISAYF